MKKVNDMKRYFLLLVIGTHFLSTESRAASNSIENCFLENDSLSSDLHELIALADPSSSSSDTSTKPILSPQDIINLTTQTVRWQDLAQEEFFLKTNELNMRHVLDLPFVMPSAPSFYSRDWVIGIVPFYAQINKAFFTPESDSLQSYLALQEETLLQKLRETFAIIQAIAPEFYVETDKIFGILKHTFIEQRRVGMIFSLDKNLEWGDIGVQIPLIYLERNFQMTQKNKDALENELGSSTDEEKEEFQKDHLISDKIGLSDMRIYGNGYLIKSEDVKLS